MPVITFQKIGQFEVESGTTILAASQRYGLFHAHVCGGKAQCSTCRVWIVEGQENSSPMQEKERLLLAKKNLHGSIRLACQTAVFGPVQVQILLRDYDDIDEIVDATPDELPLHGEERPVVIMHAGVHGMNKFADENFPYDVIHVLNKYYRRIGPMIETHGGRIDKYSGDSTMALFGLPQLSSSAPAMGSPNARESMRQAVVTAVNCARRMVAASEELNLYLQRHFNMPLHFGIAIHAGLAIVGYLGHQQQLTAIGHAVNFALGLQELTHKSGSKILISEPVFAVIRDRFPITRAFSAQIPGKSGRQNVFEVAGGNNVLTSKKAA